MSETRVLVFGTFDGLHPGHLYFLRMAKTFGDYLVVAVARDQHVRELKGREPLHPETQRQEAVRGLGYVDQVVLSDEVLGSFEIMTSIQPDMILLGHDQEALRLALEQWMKTCDLSIPIEQISEYDFEMCHNCTCGH